MGKLSLQGQKPGHLQALLAQRPGLLGDPLHTGFSEDEEEEESAEGVSSTLASSEVEGSTVTWKGKNWEPEDLGPHWDSVSPSHTTSGVLRACHKLIL